MEDLENPASAAAVLGDFTFFAGTPNEELVLRKPGNMRRDFMIMVPQNDAWAKMIEYCMGKKARKVTRYAFKKEPDVFEREKLEQIVKAMPPEYTLKMMDEEIYWWCRDKAWCKDWVSQYESYEMFQKLGLGVVILIDGVPVSGASSYASYKGGIEIEIDTKEEYRRKGLARICGAKLILECLKRGLYPSWDAQNLKSAALAEKLGYHFECEYTAYEVTE